MANQTPNRQRALSNLSRATRIIDLSVLYLDDLMNNDTSEETRKAVNYIQDSLRQASACLDVATNEVMKIKEYLTATRKG